MNHGQPFSVLNERLRPPFTTSTQLYSTLNRMEDNQLGSLRSRNPFYRPTVVPTEPKASLTQTEPEDPKEPENTSEQEDQVSDEGTFADLLKNSFLITELNLSDFGEDETGDEDRSASSSEEKDHPGELNSEGARDSSESVSIEGEARRPLQRSYINRALPDLVDSGRPLGRRRTLGHVSDTLKEVRREVELSRRRSIKLKAQVDKLQESREGPGWSQHREKVTEEVRSILKLLHPLTESESSTPEPTPGTNRLDASLAQLQTVACKLALSHTKQSKSGNGKGEESAILQQALRDRDEAIEKKKAMEAELLRSKTDLMLLNNQLLEAVQKRLELSLELENWKEDVQLMLHQQLLAQQQAEAQKKPSRLGILRRSNKPPIQRPTNFPISTPVPPTTNSKQIFVPRSAVSTAPTPSTPPPQRNWMDKLRRPKSSRYDQDAVEPEPEADKGFQVVSLD
ncbi:hypothetical protein PBY51_002843 [Eleginops maclovinus]|uniref:Uncharacterized protein n=1 Tax=Eleginops maclovinus TaxID=56733 RepID=A0AAN7XEG3_ELEMC|nr:hypothetical protein PBY51_002843 [Eleginops maclovinus]